MPFAITNADLQRLLPLARHSFLEGLESNTAKMNGIRNALVEDVPYPQDTIQLRELGSTGTWYPWEGESQSEAFNLYTGSQAIAEHHLEIPLNMRDLAFAAGPILEKKAAQAGEKHGAYQMTKLLGTHLDVDASATAQAARVLGGTRFFRVTGDSGHFGQAANVNSLTYNASNTAAMTAAEWNAVHTAIMVQMMGFKDDKGVLLNPFIEKLLYVATPGHAPGFIEAFKANLVANGGTNPYVIGVGELGGAELLTTPLVTAASIYAFNVSKGVPKPFFMLRPIAEEDYINIQIVPDPRAHRIHTVGHAMWQFGFGNQLAAVKTALT